jgi:hypothetical protein
MTTRAIEHKDLSRLRLSGRSWPLLNAVLHVRALQCARGVVDRRPKMISSRQWRSRRFIFQSPVICVFQSPVMCVTRTSLASRASAQYLRGSASSHAMRARAEKLAESTAAWFTSRDARQLPARVPASQSRP